MALGKGLHSLIPQDISGRTRIRKETTLAGQQIDQVWHIPVSEIVPNPHQPRKHFSHQELEDLVASIKQHGVMQPLVVTERLDGGYELIAGERRLRASTIAGLPTVPAIVRQASEQDKLELALIENIQRQDLNPMEEAFSYKRLVDEFGLTQQDVATKVGKSRSLIANTIRLLDLPTEIQQALMQGDINTGQARAILSLKEEKDQLSIFREMMQKSVSVRDVEKSVAEKGQASRKGSVRRDPNVMAKEQELEEKFGAPVRITERGEKGIITISFFSKDELKRLLQLLS